MSGSARPGAVTRPEGRAAAGDRAERGAGRRAPRPVAGHARQHRILGRSASARLAALDLGVAGLLAGALTGQVAVTVAGATLLLAGGAVTAALLA
ncbi:MAG TPA: hypothetical protein VNL94_01290, partial [Candidatus Binatia bacterium]|nr:hypothetical protein [Candidatus Binatia bacterium]